MGTCLSRCGETQESPRAGTAHALRAEASKATTKTGAVNASTKKSAVAREARADDRKIATAAASPNATHSLKRFPHRAEDANIGRCCKKSMTSTPRASLAESTYIPHSSELFSLPETELEQRSSFALSPWPSRGAREASSHFRFRSPSRRGRRSSKRIRPAVRAEHGDVAAHQRLVDAIARLERLNDASKTPRELARPSIRSRHVRHYQLPLPKSTKLAPAAAIPHPSVADSHPVKDFLRTVETFVSLIDQPRGTKPTSVPKRRESVDTDGEEMFTFEFGRNQGRQSPTRKNCMSLQRLVLSATPASTGRETFLVPEKVELEEKISVSSLWPPIEMVVKESRQSEFAASTRVASDLGVQIDLSDSLSKKRNTANLTRLTSTKPLLEEEGAGPSQGRETRNAKTSPRIASRMKAPKGRLSRSLGSLESSIIHVDLEIFRNHAPTAAAATPSKPSTENAVRLPFSGKLELPKGEESQEESLVETSCTAFSDSSTTAELAASETLSTQEVAALVEVRIPSYVSGESCPREPTGDVEMAFETKEMRSDEAAQIEDNVSSSSGSTEVVNADEPGDCQRFSIVEAFCSLLKLLLVFNRVQSPVESGPSANAALDSVEENDNLS